MPCFSFGENDLFDQVNNPEGSMLKWVQRHLTKLLGFSVPIFQGRGIFNYTFGLLPRRRPITTVGKTRTSNSLVDGVLLFRILSTHSDLLVIVSLGYILMI